MPRDGSLTLSDVEEPFLYARTQTPQVEASRRMGRRTRLKPPWPSGSPGQTSAPFGSVALIAS